MLTPDEAERKLTRFFAGRTEPIAAAYLFGSVARGTARAASDVDVGVLLSETPPKTLAGLLLDLEADLESYLGVPTQVVTLNHAAVDLVHRVLRDGILVCERDAAARVAFEVRARSAYFDLKPYLDEYRGSLAATRTGS